MALNPGDQGPDFALPLKAGEAPLRLSDYRGQRPVVLLFFPVAFSPGCTRELCAVAEGYALWREVGAEVIGLSVDSPWVTQRFADEVGAGFPIVSDFNREAVDAYDVRQEDFFGLHNVARRSVFVLDRDGRVSYAWVTDEDDSLPDLQEILHAVRRVV